MQYTTISEIKAANARAGQHWFEPATMRFFQSKVDPYIYGGIYFVSSERGPDDVRRYAVRYIDDACRIQTVRKDMPNLRAARVLASTCGKKGHETARFLFDVAAVIAEGQA